MSIAKQPPTAPSEIPAAQSALSAVFSRALKPEIVCVFFLIVFSFPGLFWMYPTTNDRLESYQPMQALKFFATHGQAFHKYGPFPNFVLAPFYGVTLAAWHAMGTFRPPFGAFPFGFSHPIEQINLLLVEGRLVFAILCLYSAYFFVRRLARLSNSRLLVTVVAVALFGSSYCYTVVLASTRPDALMMAFGTFFMAFYLDAVIDGLTVRRGVLLGLCAVCAVSSKELIYTVFVLPVLFLIVRAAFGKDPAMRPGRPLLYWTLITGLVTSGAYALANIVYAPAVWVERMRYWSSGEGMDPSIFWGHDTLSSLLRVNLLCVLENIGVGGAVLLAAALVAILVKRPRYSLALCLPVLSFRLIALAQIPYAEPRYFTPISIALAPLALLGLEAMRVRLHRDWKLPAFRIALCACLIANLVWGTYAWYFLDSLRDVAVRRQMLASPKDQTYFIFSTYEMRPGSNVLSRYGYRFELRPFQQILDDKGPWPDVIYITSGSEGFMRDAVSQSAKFPHRMAFMARLGFNPAGWNGFEQLGYCRVANIKPYTPAWFPYKWMYGVREQERIESLYVYSRHCP